MKKVPRVFYWCNQKAKGLNARTWVHGGKTAYPINRQMLICGLIYPAFRFKQDMQQLAGNGKALSVE